MVSGWAKKEGLLLINSHCLYNDVREPRLILDFLFLYDR